jgi:hypothetical protein
VARFYSEPMNRLIRRAFGDDARHVGSVVDGEQTSAGGPLARPAV